MHYIFYNLAMGHHQKLLAFAFTFLISLFFVLYLHFNIADEGTCSFSVYILMLVS